ncbi:uncharacterized protein BO97DRAFT_408189 [Aspergillus homomorphus CBS 101889]|uniref:Uncharacterized protein n=1 Tax=Aspergillus homomorphus (strain CBS 101889) TaxID=1450537 RepID=A0A395HMD1_ASPHC|nr:hypothetical protein BO97DRAFT_408189 [Aspergillus homomorphus CBS 101889]RAL08659.1 hypothetical protein BO97DRAFT_408189 [Aspergillus homomorphus CBS 101889]
MRYAPAAAQRNGRSADGVDRSLKQNAYPDDFYDLVVTIHRVGSIVLPARESRSERGIRRAS